MRRRTFLLTPLLGFMGWQLLPAAATPAPAPRPTPKPSLPRKKARPMAQRPLVVIENGTLQSLARRPEVVAEFGFLRPLAALKDCSKCGGLPREARAAFNTAKHAVLALGRPQKERLKQLLNARQLRLVHFRGGRSVKVTF